MRKTLSEMPVNFSATALLFFLWGARALIHLIGQPDNSTAAWVAGVCLLAAILPSVALIRRRKERANEQSVEWEITGKARDLELVLQLHLLLPLGGLALDLETPLGLSLAGTAVVLWAVLAARFQLCYAHWSFVLQGYRAFRVRPAQEGGETRILISARIKIADGETIRARHLSGNVYFDLVEEIGAAAEPAQRSSA